VTPIVLILLIAIAGPIIGSAIGVLKRPSDLFMYTMLAFAAGVMLGISFLHLIPESIGLSSVWLCTMGILIGAAVMYGLDRVVPHMDPKCCTYESQGKMKRTASLILLGIFMHNLPEGMAIATGTVNETGATLVIALAIAIHNIPEGIVTSAPYYYQSKNRIESFLLSSSTAIPIVIGFALAYFLFQNISLTVIGVITAITAGIMIYIAGDELIPMAHEMEKKLFNHGAIFSLITGVLFVMILEESLII
jgi:ZIP family zinc transporter